jgi:glycerol-3-phosphate acyltransferase PlsY
VDPFPTGELALAALVAFFGGSLPFAVWMSRASPKRDVRTVGDGNPGAMNAFRAGGAALGVAVLLLDVTKGVLPIVFARDALGLDGPALALGRRAARRRRGVLAVPGLPGRQGAGGHCWARGSG